MTQPTCPKCGSHDVAGLVASFWAVLNDNGDIKSEWRQLEAETELTPQRRCYVCDHEWGCDE